MKPSVFVHYVLDINQEMPKTTCILVLINLFNALL